MVGIIVGIFALIVIIIIIVAIVMYKRRVKARKYKE